MTILCVVSVEGRGFLLSWGPGNERPPDDTSAPTVWTTTATWMWCWWSDWARSKTSSHSRAWTFEMRHHFLSADLMPNEQLTTDRGDSVRQTFKDYRSFLNVTRWLQTFYLLSGHNPSQEAPPINRDLIVLLLLGEKTSFLVPVVLCSTVWYSVVLCSTAEVFGDQFEVIYFLMKVYFWNK